MVANVLGYSTHYDYNYNHFDYDLINLQKEHPHLDYQDIPNWIEGKNVNPLQQEYEVI